MTHNPSLPILAWATPSALLSALLLTACGGGNDGAVQPQASAQSAAATTVQLEGCAVDAEWGGARDVAVHVRTADGQLVGTAVTNRQGVFVMAVPASTTLVVDTAVSGSGGITVTTGSRSLSAGGCLLTDA